MYSAGLHECGLSIDAPVPADRPGPTEFNALMPQLATACYPQRSTIALNHIIAERLADLKNRHMRQAPTAQDLLETQFLLIAAQRRQHRTGVGEQCRTIGNNFTFNTAAA